MPALPKFQDPALFAQALTHRSYLNEHPEVSENNERLEFLGDAVLGFLVGELLYQRYPDLKEGEMSRWRAALVNEKQLAELATQLGLGHQLRLGKGVEKQKGRNSPSLLSDAFEATLGAYLLDSGVDAVREFVRALFIPVADRIIACQSSVDAKTQLQEQVRLRFNNQLPVYRIVETAGPDHARTFTVAVQINNKVYGTGVGKSKQEAEKQAAKVALQQLN
ncbi:MAG: ribonuclease III [Cyanothece sp. SIO1E1]|nr:ribonuclease III [Cyanothece sp. SIO1E1]